jgi:predicted Mrr-cat superfamily restriction endonuclease
MMTMWMVRAKRGSKNVDEFFQNIDHYDALDGETRALVPLKRFYWPVV